MSQTETKAPVVNVLTMEKKVHRPPDVIEPELARAREVLCKMKRGVDEQDIAHANRKLLVDRTKQKWGKENPDIPFDPSYFSPPMTLPSKATKESVELHRQHYKVRDLENELEEARKAVIV